ncbi:MAG: hypothetical protein HY738_09330 [Bacteroidia bacterium]|nr:hypothetical protein [Bacteroidia bacterium]
MEHSLIEIGKVAEKFGVEYFTDNGYTIKKVEPKENGNIELQCHRTIIIKKKEPLPEIAVACVITGVSPDEPDYISTTQLRQIKNSFKGQEIKYVIYEIRLWLDENLAIQDSEINKLKR